MYRSLQMPMGFLARHTKSSVVAERFPAMLLAISNAEMEFDDRRKRSKKSKGAKRKTRAMLEAERRGPLTFSSLLEEAAASGRSSGSSHLSSWQ